MPTPQLLLYAGFVCAITNGRVYDFLNSFVGDAISPGYAQH